jgi:hypothetical protein
MSLIESAKAYSNNEVVFLAWGPDKSIPGCLGFEITRIYVTDGDHDTPAGTERVLAAWVPFDEQRNNDWQPQTTSVWPVQKFTWRDLTVRQRRDKTELRNANVTLKYRIRPLCAAAPGLKPVTNLPEKKYQGDPLPLAYLDEGRETNKVVVTDQYGGTNGIRAVFNNGILSTQWLTHAFKDRVGKPLSKDALLDLLSEQGNPFRTYMAGDVLGLLRELVERASEQRGARVYLSLYELHDDELIALLKKNRKIVHLILSNTGMDKNTKEWDLENSGARTELAGVAEIHHRMFNNSGHIGHNKFAVLVDADGKAKAVLTGSTNWTTNGLCAQSNNAVLIENCDVAAQYLAYWNAIKEDTAPPDFICPDPFSNPTKNKQGHALRSSNAEPEPIVKLDKDTSLQLWRSPNTKACSKTKNSKTPPDLDRVYELMGKAKESIFFAVFYPSVRGETSIVEQTITIGKGNPSILVYGAVSAPQAMPNYVAAEKKKPGASGGGKKAEIHSTYEEGNIHVVIASALTKGTKKTKGDIVGDFEAELKSAGFAIIHDKILITDPMSKNCMVVTGSHNLGYKASYANDDNLLIIQGNQALAQAYMTHVLDLYEHYRFRAVQQERTEQGLTPWQGFLSRDAGWLKAYQQPEKGELARYLARIAAR